MRQAFHMLEVKTGGPGLHDFTREARNFVSSTKIHDGLLTCFVRHTSASLLIQENAALEVRLDLEAFFERLAPQDPGLYSHNDEGPDDMPAHIRSALTQVHLSVPVTAGRMVLGTWQGIYLFEHRRQRHVREIALHLIGD